MRLDIISDRMTRYKGTLVVINIHGESGFGAVKDLRNELVKPVTKADGSEMFHVSSCFYFWNQENMSIIQTSGDDILTSDSIKLDYCL